MALLIFVLFNLFSLTCRGVPAASLSGISLGRDLLCYAHHFQCSSWSASIFLNANDSDSLSVIFATLSSVRLIHNVL